VFWVSGHASGIVLRGSWWKWRVESSFWANRVKWMRVTMGNGLLDNQVELGELQRPGGHAGAR
jgi:hypothetical protein